MAKSISSVLGTLAMLLSAGSFRWAQAQQAQRAFDWEKACEVYKNTPIPEQDRPTAKQRRELANCVSEDLYYGFGRHSDPVKARLCAYVELEKERHSMDEMVFGREAMLMVVYANADGIARNFDLALKFACQVDGSTGEMRQRIEHLEKLKRERWTASDFDLCDDAASSFMMGQCAMLSEKFSADERPRKLARLTARWTDAERQGLRQLQEAASRFFDVRAENELDLSGVGRTEIYVSELTSLNDGFVEALERFENGQLPQFSAKEFASADAELNAAYVQARKDAAPLLTPEGIRRTEREWIRYRDAWVTFGAVKYPRVPADSWKTWLSRERTKMLKQLGY